ncbi:MAG: hypothetical protein LBQ76_03930 [Candidatus Fibromonas sp.]|nr:hypothetical protein [Candidatus Fibromonas sp.]
MSNNSVKLAIHAGQDKPVRKVSPKLAILSVAALLTGASAVFAQEVPVAEPPAEHVPAVAPEPEPVAAPPPVVIAPPPPAPVAEPVAPPPPPPSASAINIGAAKISFYGFFQLNAVYEGGKNDGKVYSQYVPAPEAEKGEGRVLLNVNSTRIGFNIAGAPKESGPEASGKFESDFLNNNDRNNNGVNGFRIRQAYGQLKFNDLGFTVLFGQAWDLITPLGAPTINQGGLQGQGSLGTRRPLLRLGQVLGPVEIAAAATDNRDIATPLAPAFQGSLKGKIPAVWAGEKQNAELIFSGLYASREAAVDTKDAIDKKKDADDVPSAWLGAVSLSLPVISIINLSGELFYGQNLSSYNVGSIGQAPSSSKNAKNGLHSVGGWGAAKIKLSDFTLAGGYGVEALDKDNEPVTGRSKNSVIFGNLVYNVTDEVFIGFEYANLSTDFVDNSSGKRETDDGKLNRFELVFNYAFK